MEDYEATIVDEIEFQLEILKDAESSRADRIEAFERLEILAQQGKESTP